LTRCILSELFNLRKILLTESFIQAWDQKLAFKNKQIDIINGERMITTGTVKGIQPNGNLTLILENGKIESITAGDLKLRPKNYKR
jgi:biotin-(acetyl-CoA carboxylase) ligase